MKCPYCGEIEDRVIDSRIRKNGEEIRRRRECTKCVKRFTTYERVEKSPIMIIKKDGRREVFEREKIRTGIEKACQKRAISVDTIENFLDELERFLKEEGKKEISSDIIGEKIMKKLRSLDDVAYVRFASVYKEFKDMDDFDNLVSEVKYEPKIS